MRVRLNASSSHDVEFNKVWSDISASKRPNTRVCTAFSTITEQNTEADDRGKQWIQVRAEVRKERLVSGFKATAPRRTSLLPRHNMRAANCWTEPNEETSTVYCLVSKVLNLMQAWTAVCCVNARLDVSPSPWQRQSQNCTKCRVSKVCLWRKIEDPLQCDGNVGKETS